MECSDEKIMSLILLQADRKSEYQAVRCLRKCQTKTFGLLIKMNLQDQAERSSIFHHAMAEFIIQVRKSRFLLTGQAQICTYLTEIARRKWLNFSKKSKKQNPPLDYAEVSSKNNEAEDTTLREKMKEALQQLNSLDREILVAFYFYNTDLEEYAQQHNISYDAAKKRISRARTKLKTILKPIEE